MVSLKPKLRNDKENSRMTFLFSWMNAILIRVLLFNNILREFLFLNLFFMFHILQLRLKMRIKKEFEKSNDTFIFIKTA
jgi:hypothetical protein